MSTQPIITDQMRRALQAQAALTPPPVPQLSMSQPMQPLPMPQAPQVQNVPNATDLTNRRVLGLGNELQRLNTSGSGIDQITKPVDASGMPTGAPVSGLRKFGGVLARIGDTALSVAAPGVAALTPGTTLHHRLLQDTTQGRLQDALENQGKQAQTAQEQAQLPIQQNQALAGQLANEEAQRGLTREQNAGTIVRDGWGRPIAWQDVQGVTHAAGDPAIPAGIASSMAVDPGKAPNSQFELWLRQNPGKTADDYQREVVQKPISAEEAASLNAVWDGLAHKHGLPQGQFRPGMPRGDAQQLESALNGAIGKQQGDTHVSISLAGLDLNRQRFNATQGVDLTDPATASAVAAVARGDLKLTDVYGRGASMAQKAAFVAAVKQMNPNYNSGDHDLELGARRYMTYGQGGQTLNALNTARGHLVQLSQAADALQNGNIQVLNRIAQEYGVQTGAPAPIVFQAIKTALTGELGKAFSGTGATVSEQAEIAKALNDAQSPAQLKAFADTNIHLMDTKKQSLEGQYTQGQQGQPNFGTAPQHIIQIGNKRYQYKGSGATDDMSNYTEVKQ